MKTRFWYFVSVKKLGRVLSANFVCDTASKLKFVLRNGKIIWTTSVTFLISLPLHLEFKTDAFTGFVLLA